MAQKSFFTGSSPGDSHRISKICAGDDRRCGKKGKKGKTTVFAGSRKAGWNSSCPVPGGHYWLIIALAKLPLPIPDSGDGRAPPPRIGGRLGGGLEAPSPTPPQFWGEERVLWRL